MLFASDSAGEGIDLAGDILSSLIVVKLPFPVPDPVMEYQRNQYEDFDLYRRDIIIPEMLIKLRQWFGRGIRREKDTAVFSILDSRASLRGRYRAEILNTLPTMLTDHYDSISADTGERQIVIPVKNFIKILIAGHFHQGKKPACSETESRGMLITFCRIWLSQVSGE